MDHVEVIAVLVVLQHAVQLLAQGLAVAAVEGQRLEDLRVEGDLVGRVHPRDLLVLGDGLVLHPLRFIELGQDEGPAHPFALVTGQVHGTLQVHDRVVHLAALQVQVGLHGGQFGVWKALGKLLLIEDLVDVALGLGIALQLDVRARLPELGGKLLVVVLVAPADVREHALGLHIGPFVELCLADHEVGIVDPGVALLVAHRHRMPVDHHRTLLDAGLEVGNGGLGLLFRAVHEDGQHLVVVVLMRVLDAGDGLVELLVGIEPPVVAGGEAVVGAVQEGVLLRGTPRCQRTEDQRPDELHERCLEVWNGTDHGRTCYNCGRVKLFHGPRRCHRRRVRSPASTSVQRRLSAGACRSDRAQACPRPSGSMEMKCLRIR